MYCWYISKDDIIKITVAAIYLYQGDAALITSSVSSTPTLQSITKYTAYAMSRTHSGMQALI